MEKKERDLIYRGITADFYERYRSGKSLIEEHSGTTYTIFKEEFFKWVAYRQRPKDVYGLFKEYCVWYNDCTDRPSISQWAKFHFHGHTIDEHGCEFCPDGDALTKYFPDPRL